MLKGQRVPGTDGTHTRVRKSVVSIEFPPRDSGAGNGCANFMCAWHFLVLSAGKLRVPIKFLFLGGGGSSGFFLEGGVEVPILFLWAWGFFRQGPQGVSRQMKNSSKVAIPRSWYRAQKPLKPGNTKKSRNSPPRVGPRKYEKNTKTVIFGPFSCFSCIFSYFRGPTRGGEFRDFFRIFFVFPGLRGF